MDKTVVSNENGKTQVVSDKTQVNQKNNATPQPAPAADKKKKYSGGTVAGVAGAAAIVGGAAGVALGSTDTVKDFLHGDNAGVAETQEAPLKQGATEKDVLPVDGEQGQMAEGSETPSFFGRRTVLSHEPEEIQEPVGTLNPEEIQEPVGALNPEEIQEPVGALNPEEIQEPVETRDPEEIQEPIQFFESKSEMGEGQASVNHAEVHDVAVATNVDDSMSFNEAFAAARFEVGAGGVFEWQGDTYNTYYKEEWNSMSQDEQNQFMASVNHASSGEPDPIPTPFDPDPIVSVTSDRIYGSVDIDGDGIDDGIILDADGNDMLDIAIDTDGDGQLDTLAHDVEMGDGIEDFSYAENISGVNVVPGKEDPYEAEPLVLAEEDVHAMADTDGDGLVDVALVDADGNDIPDVILDTTGNGEFDTLVHDVVVGDDGEISYGYSHDINGVEMVDLSAIEDNGDDFGDSEYEDDQMMEESLGDLPDMGMDGSDSGLDMMDAM